MYTDTLSKNSISNYLGKLSETVTVTYLESTESTNLVLKRSAEALPEFYTVIAGTQTKGRGRLGRSFFSPDGTGLYISTLLRPGLSPEESVLTTPAAAVAVSRAIEALSDLRPQIKWVNDIFIGGKKVCGILTEAAFDPSSGALRHVILGVGINVFSPAGGFPDDIKDIAGAVFSEHAPDIRARLAAEFLRQFISIYNGIKSGSFIEEYRKRSLITGKRINVIKPNGTKPAEALEIDDKCRLLVRYDDGSLEALASGEVSIRSL